LKIWIENYNEARRFKPEGPTIAVRVFDPGARRHPAASARWEDYPDDRWDNCPEAPWNTDAYLAVLGYTFSDINMDQPYPEEMKKGLRNDPSVKLFTANMAEDLVKKFAAVYEQADAMLAHCNAGASRSPAVANALVDIFNLKPEWQGRAERFKDKKVGTADYYIGNDFVYRLLCEAATRLKLWVD